MRLLLFPPVARLLARRPRTVVAAVLALVAASAGGIASIELKTGYDTLVPVESERFRANERFQEAFGGDALLVLLEGDPDRLRAPETRRWMERLERRLADVEEVRSVTSPATLARALAPPAAGGAAPVRAGAEPERFYPDERHALVAVRLAGNLDLTGLERATEAVQEYAQPAPPGVEATVAGTPALAKALGDALREAAVLLLGLSLALMAVVLVVVFPARWRLLSLPAISLAVVATFGLAGFLSIPLTMVTVAVLPILFGLGVDYAIQFHNRYEEEERRGDSGAQALTHAVLHIGPAVGTAVLATILGFLALYLSPVPMIDDFATLLVVGVAVAFAAGLVLVNGVLYLRDRRLPAPARVAGDDPRRLDRALGALARLTLPRPVPILAIAVALAAAGLAVDHRLGVQTDIERLMPQSAQELRDVREARAILGSAYQVNILVEGEITRPDAIAWMLDYQQRQARAHDEIVAAAGPAVLIAAGGRLPQDQAATRAALARVPEPLRRDLVADDLRSANIAFEISNIPLAEQKRLVDALERDLDPPPGIRAEPAGLTVMAAQSVSSLTANRHQMTLLSLAAVFAGLLAVYRRPRRALFPIIPIGLVVGWSSGAMVLLGIELNPLTVTLGALIVAIGTEFTVLLQERYSEERERGSDPREAMTTAISRIGRAITASALTVVAGFSTLVFTDFPILQTFGQITFVNVAFSLVAALVVMPPLIVWWEERRPMARRPRSGASVGATSRAATPLARTGTPPERGR